MNIKEDGVVSIGTLQGAADNQAYNCSVIDMTGYRSVTVIAAVGQGQALACSIKGQQGAASDLSDAADLAGTAISFTPGVSADVSAILEVKDVQERYFRAVLTIPNFTTAAPACVMYIRHGAKYLPVSNSNAELHAAPAEGTA